MRLRGLKTKLYSLLYLFHNVQRTRKTLFTKRWCYNATKKMFLFIIIPFYWLALLVHTSQTTAAYNYNFIRFQRPCLCCGIEDVTTALVSCVVCQLPLKNKWLTLLLAQRCNNFKSLFFFFPPLCWQNYSVLLRHNSLALKRLFEIGHINDGKLYISFMSVLFFSLSATSSLPLVITLLNTSLRD